MARAPKMKSDNILMIIIVVLIVLIVIYWLLTSMKHNVHESFAGDWTSNFNGYSPYVVPNRIANFNRLSTKNPLESLDQCGVTCDRNKACVAFDTKLKLTNGKKNYGCHFYHVKDRKDKKFKKEDINFKIDDSFLSPATDKDIKTYLTSKFFIKSKNDGITNIDKLDVADFRVNGIPKVTPCPKRTDCPSCYYDSKYDKDFDKACPSQYCVQMGFGQNQKCAPPYNGSAKWANLKNCENECAT
jgi:hypothetical protein